MPITAGAHDGWAYFVMVEVDRITVEVEMIEV